MHPIPQLDLSRYTSSVVEEWIPVLREIAKSGRLWDGPQKDAFEKEFATYLGVAHVAGCGSGTDALALSLRALEVGEGDEVITHANAFIAAVEAILSCRATPVLVDMSATDFGPDTDAAERVITKRTKAIIVVHRLGVPADFDPLLRISQKHGIPIIEDVAQAHGALYKDKKTGSLGAINIFSFDPVKNLAAFGEGGCIATKDAALYEKVKILSIHGQEKKYLHVAYGWNSRLDEVQAAWLRIGLRTLDARNQRRKEVYDEYRRAFSDLPLTLVQEFSDRTTVYHRGVVWLKERDALISFLKEREIAAGSYYPHALHEQEAWQKVGLPKGFFPRAERDARENVALPVFPELTKKEIDYIVSSVRSFFGK